MSGPRWLNRRQRDGGVDQVPLPGDAPGRLWLCGKHAIGPDHGRLLAEVGGPVIVVCLTERHELADRYPSYVAWLDDPSTPSRWFPIHDLHAPGADEMDAFVGELVQLLNLGHTLVLHCAAGRGRAGTTAVCVLLALGVPLDEALHRVAVSRPGAGPEVGVQRDVVQLLADRLR